jgi:hypothetical protein
MNPIVIIHGLQQIKGFLQAITEDPRIGTSHISLYLVLFQCWIDGECKEPVLIQRSVVMKVAKISGVATYHKCIRELHDYGYIRYQPSYHPACHTKVYLLIES